MKTRYVIYTTVADIMEKFIKEYKTGHGDKAKFEDISEGWYVNFEGSHEGMFLDVVRPELNKGDLVRITIERTNAKS